ncbi:MAG: Gldg family protein [Verrucomicrobiae bacterium]|nr:Gldg family protein [Verrucomicrobiae bacterium]
MNTSQKYIAGFLLLVILFLANMFAGLFSWKLDFTDGKLFTLSDGTKGLIDKLEERVDIDFYFSRSIEALPISFKNYGTRVEEMLRQFESSSNGMIRLNIIDPKPDTEEEEAATRAGITGNPVGNGETLYFGLSMTQADNQESIPFFSIQKENSLEYDIPKALYSVQLWEKPTIGLISGLPVAGTPQFFPGQQPQAQDWVFIQQLRQSFEITEINSASDWPSVVDVLMIIHPQQLDDELLFAIDQHILAGKPTMIALDPSSYFMKAQQNQQQMMMGQPPQGVSSSLSQLFTTYGIDYNEMELLVDMEYAARVSTQAGPTQMPTWLNMDESVVNKDEFIMAQLDSLLVVESGSFKKSENSELEITPLIQSSDKAGTIFAMLASRFGSPQQMLSNMTAANARLTIAGFVKGSLKSAFPDGKPKPPPEEGGEASAEKDETPETEQQPHLTESTEPANIFLIADTDWLQDQFSVQRIFGNLFQPLNDNLNLVTNAVEFMSGSRDLISIRPRGNTIRPFKVVEEIERQAQVEYQQKLEELNEEVQGFEARINELRAQQGNGTTLLLTPEVQAELQELQQNAADKRSERREVRKKLREKVESLGFRLALANLTVIPLCVFAAGILFFVRRHNRK